MISSEIPSSLLSPEICSNIVHFVSTPPSSTSSRRHLRALCLTCKALQREAVPKLYEYLHFSDAQIAYQLCHTLVRYPALGAHVRSFAFSQSQDVATRSALVSGGRGRMVIGQGFWAALHGALGTMRNLEHLVLFDPSYANSWVLNGLGNTEDVEGEDELAGRKVTEAKLRFAWDEHVLHFFQRQRRLAVAQLQSPECDPVHTTVVGSEQRDGTPMRDVALSAGSLPSLGIFDASLEAVLGAVRANAPLLNVQAFVEYSSLMSPAMDDDSVDLYDGLEEDMKTFAKVGKTLKSINLLELPEDATGRIVNVLAKVCPDLLYLGLLRLPVVHREEFTCGLMSFRSLRYIQVDISAWLPHPNTSAQRVLAAELKMFRPTIRHVVFWYHTTRFSWHYNQERWHYQIDNNQHPHTDQSWGMV